MIKTSTVFLGNFSWLTEIFYRVNWIRKISQTWGFQVSQHDEKFSICWNCQCTLALLPFLIPTLSALLKYVCDIFTPDLWNSSHFVNCQSATLALLFWFRLYYPFQYIYVMRSPLFCEKFTFSEPSLTLIKIRIINDIWSGKLQAKRILKKYRILY